MEHWAPAKTYVYLLIIPEQMSLDLVFRIWICYFFSQLIVRVQLIQGLSLVSPQKRENMCKIE